MPTDLDAGQLGPFGILFLAVLQGLAEFLPISSSGHLVLARAALEVKQAGLALDVSLHLGTLGAVMAAYRSEVRDMVKDLSRARPRMWIWLAVGTVPAGVLGLTLRHWVAELSALPSAAGVGLIVTSGILLVGEWGRSRQGNGAPVDISPDEGGEGPTYGTPSWSDAVAVGCAQALALAPGVSRSGCTISMGLLRGMPPHQAARLSFLLSVPAILGAAIVELPDALEVGLAGLSSALVVMGVLTAGLVGWGALRALLLTLSLGAFRWFSLYCLILGTVTLFLA